MYHNIKLKNILSLILNNDPLPDKWADWEDIRPTTVFKVRLRFMSEEETTVETYPEHPFLIPWYDCPVTAISPEGDALEIWLAYTAFLPALCKEGEKENRK